MTSPPNEQAELERIVGGPLRLTLDEIVNHPCLPAARKVYLDRFLKVYDGNPFLVRLLIESGRFFVFQLAAVLEAAEDPARRETWFTTSRLKQEIALFGFASDRQVDHLVRRLCAVGFLEHRQSPADRRVRRLATTAKLRAHFGAWLAAHYAPLATLYPQHDYGPVFDQDPAFHALHCRTGQPFNPAAARLMASLPDIMLFFSRAAGSLVMSALLQAAMESDEREAGVPYADAADRFGVSRTHVRGLMEAAQAAGLVRLVGRGGRRVEILPRFWASHDRGMAVGMYLHDAVNLLAMRAWKARAAGERTGAA
ncbi:MAG TPA: hypothetical protein VK438_05430 [Xanthobacteraceae bacterium]|nr:hypothetical protein [Xanthobacteraceae bacterium]